MIFNNKIFTPHQKAPGVKAPMNGTGSANPAVKEAMALKPRSFTFLLLMVLAISLCGCSGPKRFITKRGFIFGTILEVTCPSEEGIRIAFDEFKELEVLFNYYDKDSELFALNRDGRLNASSKLFELIKFSLEFSKLSGGAFDVTCAPIVDIWKKAIKEKKNPSDLEIKKALPLVGWDKVYLNAPKRLIKFKKKNMKIDLGAIAKGFAVDLVVAKLKKAGIQSALINLGGHIYCMGLKDGLVWKVGVQNPRKRDDIVEIFSLTDKAIATSGDYEQFFEYKGKRYSHIVDPRTGYAATSGIISVTVVADNCCIADAMATAIFVLGEEKGLELAKKFPNVERIRIIKEGFLKDVRNY